MISVTIVDWFEFQNELQLEMFFIVHEHIRWTMFVQHPMEMHPPALRQQCRWWFYQSWERSLVLWQRPRTLTRGSFWDLSFHPAAFQCSSLERQKTYLSLGWGRKICFVSCMFLLGYWHLKSFLIFFDPSPTTVTFQIDKISGGSKIQPFCFFQGGDAATDGRTGRVGATLCTLDHFRLSLSWRDGFDWKQIHPGQK